MMANRHQCIAILFLGLAILCGGVLLSWQSLLHAKQAPDQSKLTQSQKGAVDEKTIRDLIKQLGDDSFEKREEATKRLTVIGEPVRELVKKAALDNPDAEVRQRAEADRACSRFSRAASARSARTRQKTQLCRCLRALRHSG